MGRPHQDRASARAHGLQARLQDRTLQANMRDRLLDFLGFRPNARALERMDPRSLAHRERQPLRARRRFRRRRFAHPKEPRHRRALAIVRLQPDPGRRGLQHPQRTLACRPRYQSNPRNAPLTLRTEQPWHIRGRVQNLLDMKSASGVAGIEFIGTPTDRPAGRISVTLLGTEWALNNDG